MKKLLLIFLLIPFHSIAQQSFPLIKNGGIWRVANYGIVTPPDPWWIVKSQYLMQGDTTINNTVYKKIYQCDYSPSINNKTFVAGIRKDSTGKVFLLNDSNFQIFLSGANSGGEVLLYDFSLKVGDTLISNSLFDSVRVVEFIDSVLIGTQYRKRWRFVQQSISKREWIEGVGSVKGLFFPISHEFENYQHLSCYEDSNVFWLNPELTSDCFSVGIENAIEKNSAEIYIYPNPSSEIINLKIKENEFLNLELEIYNLTGKLIKRNYIQTFTDEYKLDIKDFQSGMYFIKLVSDKQVIYTEKFIKE